MDDDAVCSACGGMWFEVQGEVPYPHGGFTITRDAQRITGWVVGYFICIDCKAPYEAPQGLRVVPDGD